MILTLLYHGYLILSLVAVGHQLQQHAWFFATLVNYLGLWPGCLAFYVSIKQACLTWIPYLKCHQWLFSTLVQIDESTYKLIHVIDNERVYIVVRKKKPLFIVDADYQESFYDELYPYVVCTMSTPGILLDAQLETTSIIIGYEHDQIIHL